MHTYSELHSPTPPTALQPTQHERPPLDTTLPTPPVAPADARPSTLLERPDAGLQRPPSTESTPVVRASAATALHATVTPARSLELARPAPAEIFQVMSGAGAAATW